MELFRGQQVFYDAADPRMSRDGYISCGTCHFEGGHDGMTWDFTGRGEGLRNTIDLRGRSGMGHGPVHWTANFDEIQDFENDIRGAFGGTGFLTDEDFEAGTRSDPLGDPKAGLDFSLDALAAYVASFDSFPASPRRLADGSMSEAALRGEALFEANGCTSCHGGASYTDSGSELHDVGTIVESSGQRRSEELLGLDSPTLLGVWDGAPYLHDGSAGTIREVLVEANADGAHGDLSGLTESQIDDLVRFILELE